MVAVTGILQEQNKNMDDVLLKLVEITGAPEEIFRQIDMAHHLSNARNPGIIIKFSARSSRVRFFIVI